MSPSQCKISTSSTDKPGWLCLLCPLHLCVLTHIIPVFYQLLHHKTCSSSFSPPLLLLPMSHLLSLHIAYLSVLFMQAFVMTLSVFAKLFVRGHVVATHLISAHTQVACLCQCILSVSFHFWAKCSPEKGCLIQREQWPLHFLVSKVTFKPFPSWVSVCLLKTDEAFEKILIRHILILSLSQN